MLGEIWLLFTPCKDCPWGYTTRDKRSILYPRVFSNMTTYYSSNNKRFWYTCGDGVLLHALDHLVLVTLTISPRHMHPCLWGFTVWSYRLTTSCRLGKVITVSGTEFTSWVCSSTSLFMRKKWAFVWTADGHSCETAVLSVGSGRGSICIHASVADSFPNFTLEGSKYSCVHHSSSHCPQTLSHLLSPSLSLSLSSFCLLLVGRS